MLIRIGAYTKGTDAELDEALSKKSAMEKFMIQGAMFKTGFDETREALIQIMS